MITKKQLEDMSKQHIETINRNDLVDISTIQIKHDLPHTEKMLAFLEQIKNPYCFLCGGIPVRVCYSDDEPKLGEVLQDYFVRIKQG